MTTSDDKEMRIVFVFCAVIVILAASITFWAIMTIHEPPKYQPPKPAKLSREYLSDRRCLCGHFVVVHDELSDECLCPGCDCEKLEERA